MPKDLLVTAAELERFEVVPGVKNHGGNHLICLLGAWLTWRLGEEIKVGEPRPYGVIPGRDRTRSSLVEMGGAKPTIRFARHSYSVR